MGMESTVLSSGSREESALSKTQLKKLKRDQEWEANRAKRKAKRKEKLQEKKQRRRAARDGLVPASSIPANPSPATDHGRQISNDSKLRPRRFVQFPITLVLDCGFDDMMNDKERKSLGSQITRCYSDNHKAPLQAHLVVSSFGGPLKERFDGLLEGQYHSWKGVRFLEEGFVQAAEQAKEWMRGDLKEPLAEGFEDGDVSGQPLEISTQTGEVVYLTSDSPNTLTQLRPYSTYIIGGLVDRNRHKGVCYKRAMDRGMKTAKLPIGDYMQMSSRFILATNHVVEIMLRWLELRDWGKAFLKVMPKRKGGVLKDTITDSNKQPKGEDEERSSEHGENANASPRTLIPVTGEVDGGVEDVESLEEDGAAVLQEST